MPHISYDIDENSKCTTDGNCFSQLDQMFLLGAISNLKNMECVKIGPKAKILKKKFKKRVGSLPICNANHVKKFGGL